MRQVEGEEYLEETCNFLHKRMKANEVNLSISAAGQEYAFILSYASRKIDRVKKRFIMEGIEAALIMSRQKAF